MAAEEGLTLRDRIASATAGGFLTSIFVTPLDVVKIRLQKQVRPGKARPSQRKLTPFDVVKTRMQSQTRQLVPGQCFLYHNGLMDHLCTYCANPTTSSAQCEWFARPPRPSPFTGTFDGLVKIARSEGVTSLWSGLSPTLVIALPATVGYFTLNDYLCAAGKEKYGDRFWVPMIAGSTARSAIVTFTNPVEMIRTKMQSERLSFPDIGRALRETTAKEGWRGLWKGLVPTLSRDVVFTAIYWGLLDYTRAWQMLREGRSESNFRISFTSGAFSGIVAAVVTNPLDVLKTHKQIELGEASSKLGMWKTGSHMVRAHGFGSLYAGLTPRLLKVAPACAIMIGSYDYGKAFFRRQNSVSF